MKLLLTAAVAATALVAGTAQAANQTVTSTSQNVSVNGVTFSSNNGNFAGGIYLSQENTNGGSTAVTTTRPYTTAGDTGSLEIHGDRSRYIIGSLYDYANAPSFSVKTLQSFTFSYNTDQTTASQLHAAPVARVIVADRNGERVELAWEYVYNGGTAGQQSPLDQWLDVGANANWYANLRAGGIANYRTNAGVGSEYTATDGATGVIRLNGSQYNQSLQSWTDLFSNDARVIGFSFGAGSSFGAGFTGFVDNATITTRQGSDTLNFGPAAAVGDVPEPATWGMMILGFGLVGAAARRRNGAIATA